MNQSTQEILNILKTKLQKITNLQNAIEIKNTWLKEHLLPLQKSIIKANSEQKIIIGKEINFLKQQGEILFENLKEELENQKFQIPDYDLSLINDTLVNNGLTLLNQTMLKVCEWFLEMGFVIEEGSEVVPIVENFDLLNIPSFHPARQQADSFFFNEALMLRTHNTSNTANYLKKNQNQKVLKVATFGNVYRNDVNDATHSHQFIQIDFLWLQKQISLSNLKWIIDNLLQYVFEKRVKTRYRLSYFPFTEPSFEVDLACIHCNNQGCNFCKQTGWIEVLGTGLLHKNVLAKANYDPEKFQALAAGMGVERLTMIKYKISDIRFFYQNDLRAQKA